MANKGHNPLIAIQMALAEEIGASSYNRGSIVAVSISMITSFTWQSMTSITPIKKPCRLKRTASAMRFHKTILNEFYQITFRKKLYSEMEGLQKGLDDWMEYYNHERTH